MSVTFTLTRAIPAVTATRLRGAATVMLDIVKTDPDLPDCGSFVLRVTNATDPTDLYSGEQFAVVGGNNTVTFEFAIAPDHGAPSEEFFVLVEVACRDSTNVGTAFADVVMTQCDVLVSSSGDVSTTPLTMTPIAVNGPAPGSSGGFHIEKSGALASVGTIEIVGYYAAPDATALLAASELYAPRWIDETQYVPVSPAVAIPVFGSGDTYEGDWGWFSGDPLGSTIPSEQVSIVKVSLDGAPPVLAVLSNLVGY